MQHKKKKYFWHLSVVLFSRGMNEDSGKELLKKQRKYVTVKTEIKFSNKEPVGDHLQYSSANS